VDYNLLKCLKSNEFGDVFVARTKKRGKKVVLKRIDTSKVKQEFSTNEVAATKLVHPNICRTYKSFEEDGSIYVEMEYLQGSDLYDYMSARHFKAIKEADVRNIFRQLMKAVLYAHSKGFCHRDLKLENVVLCKNNKIKLIDFGLCLQGPCDTISSSWCGSTDYACPEILFRHPYTGCKADVWSLGTILFALIFAELPFVFEDRVDCVSLKRTHPKFQFPKNTEVTKEVKELILGMMSIDPCRRFSLEEVANHPWLVKPVSKLDTVFFRQSLPSSSFSIPINQTTDSESSFPRHSCKYASPKKKTPLVPRIIPGKSVVAGHSTVRRSLASLFNQS